MRVHSLIEHIDSNNFLQQYLKAKGIKNTKDYLSPSPNNFDNPWGYADMKEAVNRVNDIIVGGGKIGIVQDSDADGVMSATIAYRFLQDMGMEEIPVFIHSGKQHGLTFSEDDNIVQQIIDSQVNMVWVPDAGSNDWEQCKRLWDEANIEVLITDHHLYDKNDYAFVINVHNPLNDIQNHSLTGTGVTYKFIEAYRDKYAPAYEFSKFRDLVAFSIVSDVSDLTTLENRAFLFCGNKHINNPMLKEMLRKFGRKEELTPHCISMYLAPKINAVCRSSNISDKKALFNGFVSDDKNIIDEAIKVASEAHTEQSNITKELYEELDKKIVSTSEDNIVVTFGEAEEKNYLGLAANKLVSRYHKPCIVLRELNPTTWTGSLRSPVDVASQINTTKLAICRGHESACGIDIKKANLKRFVKWVNKHLDIDPSYDVTGVITPSEITIKLCKDCEDWPQLWGISGGNILVIPTFYVEVNVKKEELFFCGKKNNSVKITKSDVDFWMFRCDEKELNKLTQYPEFTLKMIVKLGVNSWEGKTNPKAIVDNFEVEQYEETFEDVF